MLTSLEHLIHELLRSWFHWVEAWGYWGVFILMAMESSIIPVPSEIVLPPAAFWAAQGKMSLSGVIAAGTLGSYLGSALSYAVARYLGAPLLKTYGKRIFLTPEKLSQMESWALSYGIPGVFFARLLPVVRHLISLPAGALRLPFFSFSVVTLLGAGLWCSILALVGQAILGASPELLESPEAMVHTIKGQLHTLVGAILAFAGLYVLVLLLRKKAALKSKLDPAIRTIR
jgi:membrane protein DedA with SNARE-associated domain